MRRTSILLLLMGVMAVTSRAPLWAEEEGHGSAEKPKPKQSGPPEESEEKSGGEATPYMALPTFIIPVIQDRQLVTAYSIDITVEATSKEIMPELFIFRPRIIDALFTDMYSVFCLVWSPDTRVLLKDLKVRLLRVTQKVAGKKRVRSVLIQSFGEQLDRKGA